MGFSERGQGEIEFDTISSANQPPIIESKQVPDEVLYQRIIEEWDNQAYFCTKCGSLLGKGSYCDCTQGHQILGTKLDETTFAEYSLKIRQANNEYAKAA